MYGKKVRFPQYLNAPLQVLWFEADELGLFFGFFGLALMSDSGWLYLAMLAVPVTYSKIKSRYARGFLKHLLYVCGLMEFDGYPNAFIKRFTE